MADEKVTYLTRQSDVWWISIMVTFMTLCIVFIAVCLCWERLCAKIVIDALGYGAKQVATRTFRDFEPYEPAGLPSSDRPPSRR